MIVVDESIDNALIQRSIADWYSGRVVSIRSLRPATLIHDETIPTLLHQAKQLTFVTINVDDFWKKVSANQNYCIIAIELEQGQALQLPFLLRRLLRLPEFRTKTARMGKVIRMRSTAIEYYSVDRQIQKLLWPD